jgi:hypothetical protein
VFVSKKEWNLINEDIRELQDELFTVQYNLKKLVDADNKAKAMERHPSLPKKKTTKKVEKNGK